MTAWLVTKESWWRSEICSFSSDAETAWCLVPLKLEYFSEAKRAKILRWATSQERKTDEESGEIVDLTVKKLLEFSKKKITKGLPWWPRLCSQCSGSLGSIPQQVWRTKIPHASTKTMQLSKEKYFFGHIILFFIKKGYKELIIQNNSGSFRFLEIERCASLCSC